MNNEIQEIIDRETNAWSDRSLEPLLSIFHPDFVWIWPTEKHLHDPITWTSIMGKFDETRWRASYRELFEKFQLVRNERQTKRIFVTKEGDGAFAVVDVDTQWRSANGEEMHWLGRTCKTYVKTLAGWKMISQVGVLDYS